MVINYLNGVVQRSHESFYASTLFNCLRDLLSLLNKFTITWWLDQVLFYLIQGNKSVTTYQLSRSMLNLIIAESVIENFPKFELQQSSDNFIQIKLMNRWTCVANIFISWCWGWKVWLFSFNLWCVQVWQDTKDQVNALSSNILTC